MVEGELRVLRHAVEPIRPASVSSVVTAVYENGHLSYVHTRTGGDPLVPPVQSLGIKHIQDAQLAAACRNAINELNAVCMNKDAIEEHVNSLRGPGRELADALMPARVQNFLLRELKSASSVTLVTNLACIPWEFCHLGGRPEGGFPLEIGCLSRARMLEESDLDLQTQAEQPDIGNPTRESVVIVGESRLSLSQESLAKDLLEGLSLYPYTKCSSLDDFQQVAQSARRIYVLAERAEEGAVLAESCVLRKSHFPVFRFGPGRMACLASCYSASLYDCASLNADGNDKPLCAHGQQPMTVVAYECNRSAVLGPLTQIAPESALRTIASIEESVRTVTAAGKPQRTLAHAWKRLRTAATNPMWRFFSLAGSWEVLLKPQAETI